MQSVTLKNGSEEFGPAVRTIMLNLESLLSAGQGVAVHEAMEIAKDPTHIPFGNAGETLLRRDLIEAIDEQGHCRMHSTVRNVLLSAAVGDGFGVSLGSPYVNDNA